jgi:hypothetical protein
MTLPESEYEELHRRSVKLLDLADWDDIVLDQARVDWLRIRLLGDFVSIESVNHASIIYRAHIQTGSITNWNADLIPGVLKTLRARMVLDDLADV